MGFFDSLKVGLGRIGEFAGGLLEAAAPIFGPPLIEAGVQALRGALDLQPQQTGRGPAPFQQRGFARQPQTFALPGGANVQAFQARQLPFQLPSGPTMRRMAEPSPSPFPLGSSRRSPPGRGGRTMPGFPGDRFINAAFQLPSIPIPFTGLQIEPDLPFIDIGQRAPAVPTGIPMVPFRPTMAGAASQRFVATNPVSGRAQWFGPLGHPILFSRDFAVVRRVSKIAARARRVRGRR